MADKKNPRADRVWDRLIESYGARVTDAFGKEIPESWSRTIENLTDQQIIHGLRQVQRDTPIHPPTLGQFNKACLDMPLNQHKGLATVQEQLCEYAAMQLRSRLTPIGFSRPWTYVYREWWDETRPKGFEKSAECKGIVIELDDGTRLGFSIDAMTADAEGHQRALRHFRPGPHANQTQADALQLNIPDLRE